MKILKSNIAIILIINGLIINLFASPVFADTSKQSHKQSHKQTHNNNKQYGKHLKKSNSTVFRNKQRHNAQQTTKNSTHNKSWKKEGKHKKQEKIIKTSNKLNGHKQKHVNKHIKKHKTIRHNNNHNNHNAHNNGIHNNVTHNNGNHRNDHHNRNHRKHRVTHRRNHNYFGEHRRHHFRARWYNTHYLAPIQLHFHQIGHVINTLPHRHSRIHVGGLPYFYSSGVFYQKFGHGYIVISAPIGARIRTLPVGFIGFSIGLSNYYTVNDSYYTWDDANDSYYVVDKPVGATDTIDEITQGRLIIEPLDGQDEKQQAKDRYACHRWAVSESSVDPTEEDQEISEKEDHRYKQAISACLEDRNYNVIGT